MVALAEQLCAMSTTLDNRLVAGILVSSIDVFQLQPVSAAIKTLSEYRLSLEDVTGWLIEKCKAHKDDTEHRNRAYSASTACDFCRKTNHKAVEQ